MQPRLSFNEVAESSRYVQYRLELAELAELAEQELAQFRLFGTDLLCPQRAEFSTSEPILMQEEVFGNLIR